MQPQLQRVEVEPAFAGDHDLAVEYRVGRQRAAQRRFELGEVTRERFEIAALDVELVACAEHQGAEAVPLGLVRELALRGQRLEVPRQHGLDGWAEHSRYLGSKRAGPRASKIEARGVRARAKSKRGGSAREQNLAVAAACEGRRSCVPARG
jgi:hypothetical protein